MYNRFVEHHLSKYIENSFLNNDKDINWREELDNWQNNEEDDLDEIFEHDEPSTTKYNLALCEIYNAKIDGSEDLNGTFLLLCRLKSLNMSFINLCILNYVYNMLEYISSSRSVLEHDTIRNYKKLFHKMSPDIVETNQLVSGEIVCIKKTIWIKLIQKRWKRIFKQRVEIIRKRSSSKSIRYREINGHWPDCCSAIPSLKGMLSSL